MRKTLGNIFRSVVGVAKLTSDGHEILDPKPMDMPLGFERPPSIQELIKQLVTDPQLRSSLDANGVDTFDDADDFDVPGDDVPQSPHEDRFDPLHLLAREQELMSGTVIPRTPDEIKAAADAIAKVRSDLKAAKAPPAPKVDAPQAGA